MLKSVNLKDEANSVSELFQPERILNNITAVYFVRHAQSNFDNHDDLARELTAQGFRDRKFVTDFLLDKNIDVALSSPYKRAGIYRY